MKSFLLTLGWDLVTLDLLLLDDPGDVVDLRGDVDVRPRVGIVPNVQGALLEGGGEADNGDVPLVKIVVMVPPWTTTFCSDPSRSEQ